MPTWTPPTGTALSTADVRDLTAALLDLDQRAAAFAFLETLEDPAAVYTVACDLAYVTESQRPLSPSLECADYLSWIGQRI